MNRRVRAFNLVLFIILLCATTAIGQNSSLKILEIPQPVFPDGVERIHAQGTIIVRIQFLSTGQVGTVATVKGFHSKLNEIVAAAARKITFTPQQVEGKTTDISKQIEYGYWYGTWTPRRSLPVFPLPKQKVFVAGAQDGRVQARLAQRSGVMEFRVWDLKTKQFIYAGLGIYPVKVRYKAWHSMSIATGDDGGSHTVNLSPGTYLVKVERYLCNGKNFFSDRPQSFRFVVKTGRRQRKTLTVDVSKIRAKRSYDNLDGKPCS